MAKVKQIDYWYYCTYHTNHWPLPTTSCFQLLQWDPGVRASMPIYFWKFRMGSPWTVSHHWLRGKPIKIPSFFCPCNALLQCPHWVLPHTIPDIYTKHQLKVPHFTHLLEHPKYLHASPRRWGSCDGDWYLPLVAMPSARLQSVAIPASRLQSNHTFKIAFWCIFPSLLGCHQYKLEKSLGIWLSIKFRKVQKSLEKQKVEIISLPCCW